MKGALDHAALFCLPPIAWSTSTAIAAPAVPFSPTVETGDKEIDAVLWFRKLISTGEPSLVEKALLAAKRISTPMAQLEKRYTSLLVASNPGNVFAAMGSFGFTDLEDHAKRSAEQYQKRAEALARFGSQEAIFRDTPAEQFCKTALRGLKRSGPLMDFAEDEVDSRFLARAQLLPKTLAECLRELHYWTDLYWLRNAFEGYCGDPIAQASARDWFVFRRLACIAPASTDEAIAVFGYLKDGDRMEQTETDSILLNLISRRPANPVMGSKTGTKGEAS